MPNEVTLQSEGRLHPVDENLRPILVGGKATAIETAQNGDGARVVGDLEVLGDISFSSTSLGGLSTTNLVITDSAQVSIRTGSLISMRADTAIFLEIDYTDAGNSLLVRNGSAQDTMVVLQDDSSKTKLILYEDGGSGGDYLSMEVAANGATEIKTVDTAGESADLTMNIDGFIDINSASGEHITLDAGGDISLDADGGNIYFKDGGVTYIDFQVDGSDDKMAIAGNIAIDATGAITLDSGNGRFLAMNAGTQFSATNSAYAGMILGYTEMAYGTVSGRYVTTTSFVVINDNYDHGDGAEDHFLGVTFVVPPSNRVEIEVYLPFCTGLDGTFKMGLATATDATTLKAKFEVNAWDVDETDSVQVVKRWVIDGSDSGMEGGAWSAGESKTIYCMVLEAVVGGRLFWGDALVNYGDMTMKATALPVGIGDGT